QRCRRWAAGAGRGRRRQRRIGRLNRTPASSMAPAAGQDQRGVRLRATRTAGVEGLRFHDLRHTAATLALAAGANTRAPPLQRAAAATTRELMERMGHASPAAALRYQHVMAGRDAAIAAALDALIEAAAALTETPPPAPSGTRVARIGQSGSGKKRR